MLLAVNVPVRLLTQHLASGACFWQWACQNLACACDTMAVAELVGPQVMLSGSACVQES